MPENGHFGSLSALFSKKENIPKTQTQFQVLHLFVHLSVYVSNSLLLVCFACVIISLLLLHIYVSAIFFFRVCVVL